MMQEEAEKYECQVTDDGKWKSGRVKSKDQDHYLFRGLLQQEFNTTIAKSKCRVKKTHSKTKKSIAFRDLKSTSDQSPPLPLTDTIVFDKEQAPVAIGSTRSLKQDKLPKDDVNWETYKPTLRVYSLKTVMDDKFEYYVRINSVSRPSSSEDTLFTWNCTLLQPTDANTQNINVSFPPPPEDPKQVVFWNHLQVRRRATEKQEACKKEADEVIQSLKHELELLSKAEPPPSAASSKTPSSSSREKKIRENDYFHAQVNCDSDTPFTDENQTLQCLEGNQDKKGYVFRVTGKVIQITKEHITIDLYAIETFNRKDEKQWTLLDKIQTKQYKIRNDPQLLIWRSYERFVVQYEPKLGDQFQSKIACKITGAVLDLGGIYGDRLYINNTNCLQKKDSKEPLRDVLGTVKKVSGNKMTVGLFLKEDPVKPLYYGEGLSSKTDFTLDYNPKKYALWKHSFRLVEDGSQQVGTVSVTLRDVEGDGNCFFRALFQALSSRRLIEKLTPTLPPDAIKDETIFIGAFRQYLADNIDAKLQSLIKSLQDPSLVQERVDRTKGDLVQDPSLDSETIKLKIQGLSKEFQTILKSSASLDNKLAELKNAVSRSGTYVSEPEVELTQELLAKLGIFLVIQNDKTKWTHLYNLNEQRIVLVNVDEKHYKWCEFPPPSSTKGGGGTTTFRRRRRQRHRTLRRRQGRQTQLDLA